MTDADARNCNWVGRFQGLLLSRGTVSAHVFMSE